MHYLYRFVLFLWSFSRALRFFFVLNRLFCCVPILLLCGFLLVCLPQFEFLWADMPHFTLFYMAVFRALCFVYLFINYVFAVLICVVSPSFDFFARDNGGFRIMPKR